MTYMKDDLGILILVSVGVGTVTRYIFRDQSKGGE